MKFSIFAHYRLLFNNTKLRILIGIDDTDNKDSRGTGYLARTMGAEINARNLGTLISITRHQLYVHPEIAYTSQNSSACLEIKTNDFKTLQSFCREFLLLRSAEGSDAGLCIVEPSTIPQSVIEWGKSCKDTVRQKIDAENLASANSIYLEGLTGEKIGIIGSLAAVGLRKSGNDGRFIWMDGKNLRELEGTYSVSELIKKTSIDNIETINGQKPLENELIDVGNWVRPVWKDYKKVFYIEENNHENIKWKAVAKEYIRTIS